MFVSSSTNPLFKHAKYRSLNSNLIRCLIHRFKSNPTVIHASDIRMQSLLSGGIVIKRKNEVNKYNKIQDDKKNAYNKIFTKWSKEVDQYCMSVGFAGVKGDIDPIDGIKPVTINLENVDIEYFLDEKNQPEWMYFRKPGPGTLGLTREQLLIPDVLTLYTDVPAHDGRIRSKMMSLIPYILYHEQQLVYSSRADDFRSRPIAVTEHPYPRADSNKVEKTGQASGNKQGNGTYPASVLDASSASEANNQEKQRFISRYVNTPHAMIEQEECNMKSDMELVFSEVVDLEIGQTLAKHTLPEGPAMLLEFEDKLTSMIYQAFGIPLSMVTGKGTSTGGSADSAELKSKGGSGNVQELFRNAQKDLQCTIIGFIETVWQRYYFQFDAVEYMSKKLADLQLSDDKKQKTTKKGEQQQQEGQSTLERENQQLEEYGEEATKDEEIDKARRDLDIIVTIPSIPDSVIIQNIYAEGFLKPQGYIDYMCAKYNILPEYMNANPKPPEFVREMEMQEHAASVQAKYAPAPTQAAAKK